MNKKKMLGVMACLTAMSVTPAVTQAAADPFAAVPFESGLYEDVAALVHDGLIYGYTDNSFDTKHQLSRYEMAIFTGKALSAYKNANPADQARIKKLAAQFKDELVNMGATNIPGVSTRKGSSNAGGGGGTTNIGRGLGNVTISGKVEHLWNAEKKRYGNRHDSYRYSNDTRDKNFDIEITPKLTANLGGGWQGEIGFYGAKNRGGIARSNENVSGYFDVTTANFHGPINKRSWIEIGRDKSSTFKSIVMGEYWNGILWKQKINKNLTLNFTWAKPDYNKPDTIDKIYVPVTKKDVKTYLDADGNYLSDGSTTTSTVTNKYYYSGSDGYQLTDGHSTYTGSWSEEVIKAEGTKYAKHSITYTPDTTSISGISFIDSRSVADTYVNL